MSNITYGAISESLMYSSGAVDLKNVCKKSEIGGRGNPVQAYVGMIYYDEDTDSIEVVKEVGDNGIIGKSNSVLDSSSLKIDPSTGNWIINGVETDMSAKGDDGHSPYVGTDGYWYDWNPSTNSYQKTQWKAECKVA